MHTPYALAALLAAAPLVSAAPAERSFSLAQKATGKHRWLNGPKAMEATFLKYGKPVPEHIAKAAAAAQQGSVTTNPEQFDEAYLTPVTFGGNSGQTLMMDFDTGSSDLWVFSTELPSSQSTGHTLYNPSSSTTAKQLTGESWNIKYGDGSGASGNVFADQVAIGPVTATSQAVEAATSVSSSFTQNTDNDGLVGLAFSSLNTVTPDKQTTFFDTVKSSLSSPLFCAGLRKGAPGVYDFGFIDTSKFTGTIAYTPVNTSRGFWEFTAAGYTIGSGSQTSASLDAIMDTGTTLIYLPSNVVRAYYAKVSGARNSLLQGGFIFPCSATLPSLGITIGGVSHTVPGSFLNFAPASGNNCFGGLQSSASLGINILGDVFQKSQYIVFDGGNTRLGVAAQS